MRSNNEFDRLIEQKDQELALNGEVSPFTQRQLQAYADGRPVPHVNVQSPAIALATAQLFESLRAFRGIASEDDDLWFDCEAEARER